MKKTAVNVFVAEASVGKLFRSDVAADTFLFGYREDAAATQAVSLTMPIRADHYDAMGGLAPVFEMNLPEGALKERLRLQFAKAIPAFDDLDLLQIVGASQIGRLRYSAKDEIDEAVPLQDLDEVLTYQGSADLFAHLLERFATCSGISGVQPKVLIRDEKAPERLTHRGATHIVKSFDPAEYPELGGNEYICTLGAAAAGINVPRVRLSENRRLLIVDRFDLDEDGSYLGIEDFCVLNGRRAHGRYDGSYELISKRITDYVSPAALTDAREQYALTVAYACTIGNGDAHLKNFSVLYDQPEDTVSLAPAYDMVSTQPYSRRDTLALTLGGSKDFPQRAGLLKFVRHATGKTEKAAGLLLDQVQVGAETAINAATDYARRHTDTGQFAERLIAVIRSGLERVAAQVTG